MSEDTSADLVGILIFDDVEVLDFCGPFEVFSVTEIDGKKSFDVVTVAEKKTVLARNGLSVNADYLLDDAPPFDIFLVPGGQGTRQEIYNDSLVAWVASRCETSPLVLSVCTGALLLAKAGRLEGLRATTHTNGMKLLEELAPNTELCPGERYIDNGDVVTSAGISAGIDMSFHVVSRLHGEQVARATALHMEYDWPR